MKQVLVYGGGRRTQWILLTYKNRQGAHSQVKVKLQQDTPYIEFEVFFAALDKKRFTYGQEVTINWATRGLDSRGVFYTDANAYKMVKRERDKPEKKYPVDENIKLMPVP